MSKRSIKVDFNTGERPVEVLEQRALRHEDETWGGILRLKKATRVQYHRIWVTAQLPEAFRVRGTGPVVSLKAPLLQPDGDGAELRDFAINSATFPYSVVLDPSVIEDVMDDSLQSVDVKVHLGRVPVVSEAEEVEEFVIRLDLVKARPQPRHQIRLSEALRKGYEHRRGEHAVPLGTYCVENAAALRFAHALDCDAWIQRDALSAVGAVSFGKAAEACGDVRPGQVKIGPDGQLIVRGLAPGGTVCIPLYADMERIANPDGVADLPLSIALQYRADGETLSLEPCEAVYKVLRDRRTTALSTLLVGADETRPLHSQVPVVLEDPVQWVSGRNGTIECFTLRLGNSAENGSGVVQIRNLRMAFADPSGEPVRITWREGAGFRVNGGRVDEVPRTLDFLNGVGACRDFTVSIRHADIEALPEEVASVHCTVDFEYQELPGERPGLDNEPPRAFHAEMRFRVELDLGPSWLGIDFGTSAIVAAHSAGGAGTVPLLDLQKPLRESLQAAVYTADQVPEYGTRFLSSSLVLQDKKALGARDRRESIVELAPLRQDLSSAPFRIPYLKALVGTTYLPDLVGTLERYTYRLTEGAPPVPFRTHPLATEMVLRETYARLLADYVAPQLDGASPRKLVFTVPNSFTPRHVDQLRTLITTRFPRFKREYVSFISESDAVACYYLARWSPLNTGRPAAERDALRPGDEHVLVYDMGAGTLDLTFLRIHTDDEGLRTVHVIGRMGRSTAGNYLDYLLAREIYRAREAEFEIPMFGEWISERVRKGQTDFKDWVQLSVKPGLDGDRSATYAGSPLLKEGRGLSVELKALRESEPVREFVRASTEDVLKNFFRLFASPEGLPYREGGVPLDTVVFSGRSMQLGLLRHAVVKQLKRWSGRERVYVVDSLDPQALKSAVVQGALQFAALYRRQSSTAPVRIHNPNLQARYGVLYFDQREDRWAFKELLNPATRPLSPEPVVQDGMTIFSYNTDKFDADPANDDKRNFVDLRSTPLASFVQSFAADTAAEFNAGRVEYITPMAEFTAEQVGYGGNPAKVPVAVRVDDRNQMVLQLGKQTDDPTDPLRMNLLGSRTFRDSMWPLLPRNEE
jgi:hypothetical protein